ncbi:hypothetical protein FGO68_gene11962 [Halteria grandinella]|uniref:Ubiquitin carboxyl-terminal hydrolase n=1 Tax=Halteria grandinella TaxID=5974 RepID=A0A8J8NDK6_HALGN|nr:hypothetical protein FGO68_gene11962 [Halteria grandinella]
MSGGKWCTIESDPGVFTELIKQIGVKGVQVDELVTLEDEELAQIKPIYGLIFLFKWQQDPASADKRDPLTPEQTDPELFFANQVINDACATYALLSILMNRATDLDIGDELRNLKDFSLALPSRDRGWAIGNSEIIRTAHNSFSRQDPFEIEYDKKSGEKEDAFHFISYVPFNGQLYELDGLQKGPICYGECTEQDWIEKARAEVQKRIARYESSEIRFTLLALVADKKELAEREIQRLKLIRSGLQKHLGLDQSDMSDSEDFSSVQKELDTLLGEGRETVAASLEELSTSIANQEMRIMQENERQARWKAENERRRHNYVPLIFELLQQLAKKNMLEGMFKDAVEAKKKKQEEKKAKKAAAAGK